MSTPIIITIPKYVTATSGSSHIFKDYVDFKSQQDNSVKSRKRRLDHLSWEEKLQRKKLKNRVAAQTSRDRKKQKMDEMEATLEELMDKNEKLMSECAKLQSLNKKLSSDNGRRNTIGSCSEQATDYRDHAEDPDDLSAVPDLLADFDTELDIDKLEEFAQSLLEDITADMEAAAAERQTSSSGCEKDCSRKMVGSTSERVEPGGDVSEIDRACVGVKSDQQQIFNIPSSPCTNTIETIPIVAEETITAVAEETITEVAEETIQTIVEETITAVAEETLTTVAEETITEVAEETLTTVAEETITAVAEETIPTVAEETIPTIAEEIIYTTLTDDCITIIVSDDVPIGEAETEIITTEPDLPSGSRNLAEFVSSYRVSEEDDVCESLSVAVKSERALSDCGYESFGSPHSECSDTEMSELWNQDVSELFPNLI